MKTSKTTLFLTDTEYTELVASIAQVLNGTPISQAESILNGALRLIKESHVVDANTKRFAALAEAPCVFP